MKKPFQNGVNSKRKESASKGANSFNEKSTHNEKGDNNENRVASHESKFKHSQLAKCGIYSSLICKIFFPEQTIGRNSNK